MELRDSGGFYSGHPTRRLVRVDECMAQRTSVSARPVSLWPSLVVLLLAATVPSAVPLMVIFKLHAAVATGLDYGEDRLL